MLECIIFYTCRMKSSVCDESIFSGKGAMIRRRDSFGRRKISHPRKTIVVERSWLEKWRENYRHVFVALEWNFVELRQGEGGECDPLIPPSWKVIFPDGFVRCIPSSGQEEKAIKTVPRPEWSSSSGAPGREAVTATKQETAWFPRGTRAVDTTDALFPNLTFLRRPPPQLLPINRTAAVYGSRN